MSHPLIKAAYYPHEVTHSTRLGDIPRKNTDFIVDRKAHLFKKNGSEWVKLKQNGDFRFYDELTHLTYLAKVCQQRVELLEEKSLS